jgi:hypothetical protein
MRDAVMKSIVLRPLLIVGLLLILLAAIPFSPLFYIQRMADQVARLLGRTEVSDRPQRPPP